MWTHRATLLSFFSFSLFSLFSLFTAACANGTTMCQSGTKMGTQCYNSSLQTTYSSPPPQPAPPLNAPQTNAMSSTPQR